MPTPPSAQLTLDPSARFLADPRRTGSEGIDAALLAACLDAYEQVSGR